MKANSIHHSYQRACTTHDTWNWEVKYMIILFDISSDLIRIYSISRQVRDNVAFDVRGHTYFVEDGVEHGNSITGNLGNEKYFEKECWYLDLLIFTYRYFRSIHPPEQRLVDVGQKASGILDFYSGELLVQQRRYQ